MRQKADKLEKGKWYADLSVLTATFLKYSHEENGKDYFSDQIGDDYVGVEFFLFSTGHNWYLPTPEDIEKYNLNETE